MGGVKAVFQTWKALFLFNVYYYFWFFLFAFCPGFSCQHTHTLVRKSKLELQEWQKCQCSFSMKAASLVLDVSPLWDACQIERSRSVLRHSRCTPQQNANGRHKALCWQDFDMGIVNSQGKRGVGCPGALIPPASLYTLSGGMGWKWPQEVRYLHLLDHIYPLITNSISVWLRQAWLDHTVWADLTALHWNIHKVISM